VLREEPEAVLELLRLAGHPIAGSRLGTKVVDSELTEAIPSARNADLVTLVEDENGRVCHVVVVEVQRARDDDKLRAWPLYVAYLGARHGVPVTLLVLAADRAVARWVRTAVPLGPNMVFTPIVIGSDDLPEIRSAEEALAHPAVAALTALARLDAAGTKDGRERAIAEVLRICEAFVRADFERRGAYLWLIHGTSHGAFRATLEKLLGDHGMTALQMILKEGEAKGEAKALLTVLRARGLVVDAALEGRVRGVTDLRQLEAWIERAASATRLEDVFAD